jgi:hypothetical protein
MRGRALPDAPARGLLHETDHAVVFGAVVGDDGVTGEGSAGVDGTGVAGFGAGLALALRPAPRALFMSATCGARLAVSGRLARRCATA